MLALNFLREKHFEFYHVNYLQAFRIFNFHSFWYVHVIFQNIKRPLQENILHHFLHYSFL